MEGFKNYVRKGVSEMRPYEVGEDITNISIAEQDKLNGSPKVGDMIARNPKNHADVWLVAKAYFEDNLELVEKVDVKCEGKTLHNTTASKASENVKDIVFWGDGDMWKLLGKASSKNEGWMKSSKAMQVPNGCVVQVTTQQGDNVAEAVTFVPGVRIQETKDEKGLVISRKLTI